MNSTEEPTAATATKKPHYEKPDDIIGRRFGMLVALERSPTNTNRLRHERHWKCRCDCGNERVVRGSYLRNGQVTSCGCARVIPYGGASQYWKGCGEVSKTYWSKTRRRARKHNRPFTISVEDMNALLMKQEKKCALSGLPIETAKRNKANFTASLDRIDNTKGYTPDNVQWLHRDVNFMKGELSQAYFEDLCRRVNETCAKRAAHS